MIRNQEIIPRLTVTEEVNARLQDTTTDANCRCSRCQQERRVLGDFDLIKQQREIDSMTVSASINCRTSTGQQHAPQSAAAKPRQYNHHSTRSPPEHTMATDRLLPTIITLSSQPLQTAANSKQQQQQQPPQQQHASSQTNCHPQLTPMLAMVIVCCCAVWPQVSHCAPAQSAQVAQPMRASGGGTQRGPNNHEHSYQEESTKVRPVVARGPLASSGASGVGGSRGGQASRSELTSTHFRHPSDKLIDNLNNDDDDSILLLLAISLPHQQQVRDEAASLRENGGQEYGAALRRTERAAIVDDSQVAQYLPVPPLPISPLRRLIKRSGISDQRLAEIQMIRTLKKQLERASKIANGNSGSEEVADAS